jgi:hypothetical protein
MGLEYRLGGYNKWLDVAGPSLFFVTGAAGYNRIYIYFSSHFRRTTDHQKLADIFRVGGVQGGGYYEVNDGILRFYGTSEFGPVPDDVAYAFGEQIVKGIIEESGTRIDEIVTQMEHLNEEQQKKWDRLTAD